MNLEDFQAQFEHIFDRYFIQYGRTEELDALMEEIYNLCLAYKGEIDEW